MSEKPHVIMFGLDGATYDILLPLIKNNRLPNIQSIMSNGISYKLKSTIPSITAVAWTSACSGLNPLLSGTINV